MPRFPQIEIGVPAGYPELVAERKTRIRSAQVHAAFAVNRELILLYWSIGRDILARQTDQGWGRRSSTGWPGTCRRSSPVSRASVPARWPDEAIVQQVAAQLPWGHHMVLLDRAKDAATRLWYLHAAVEHGWSRNILVHMIQGSMHEREVKALTNFRRTLPPEGSDMAEQILRDPYNFDFLTLADDYKERELERGLLLHLRDLLLELGRGFAFVGSQVPLTVGDETFYI